MKISFEAMPIQNFMVWVSELKGDENFVSHRNCFAECLDSERWEVNEVIREEGKAARFALVFNQCNHAGTTGWEFWTEDREKALACAEKIAQRLGLTLTIVN
jgi:hypothetical protein